MRTSRHTGTPRPWSLSPSNPYERRIADRALELLAAGDDGILDDLESEFEDMLPSELQSILRWTESHLVPTGVIE